MAKPSQADAAVLLQWVSAGKLSAGKMVELLGITYYDVPALAAKYGLEIGATGEQSRYALEQFAPAVRQNLKSRRPQ